MFAATRDQSANVRLKKLFADALLDNAIRKSCSQKNGDLRRQARGW
jgi:hypothetical protein